MVGMRGGCAAALGALALALFAAAPACAADWQVTELADGSTDAVLWDMACPSASLCVTVGSNSTVASSTNPTGGAAAWKPVHPEGYLGTYTGRSVRYPGNAIRGVSCPSPALCVAAGPQGNILSSTNPTGDAGAWSIAELGLDATHMTGVSCPTTSLCVAVAYNGKIVSSTNPTGGAAAWTVTKLAGPFDLLGISCPSPALCVAVDNDGRILNSTNPTGGAAAWSLVGAPAGLASLGAVDCPSTSLCVTANAGQILTSTEPAGGPGGWKVVTAGSGLPVKGISCPSTSACAAVDNNADAIVSNDPIGGPAAWSFVNVIPAASASGGSPNGMFGISCPTKSLCAAGGNDEKVITSADPFAADSQQAAGGTRRSSRRPRVKITRHPPKRVKARKHGARVAFRFRGIGRVARFRCRLTKGDGRGARRGRGTRRRLARLAHRTHRAHRTRRGRGGRRGSGCHSPKRYRLGRGRYTFRVVPIAPGGRRGHPATFRFRIGDLEERGPIGTCAPGQTGKPGSPCIEAR